MKSFDAAGKAWGGRSDDEFFFFFEQCASVLLCCLAVPSATDTHSSGFASWNSDAAFFF